ncbi:hypothetical protein AB5J62_34145 [Amycolatopsis sp. cg5]|uniref:hypothetical protein n=1 Tax=Amycolatopsis sp. cg5 TaxID=3238802 RepID=UPI0035245F17
MAEPITAVYVQEDDDWTITVSGLGKKLTARAPGIIAARDTTDQLVDRIAPEGRPTVVHLLNGSALAFTSAYMTARLTLPEGALAPIEIPPPGKPVKPIKDQPKTPLATSKQLSKAVEEKKPVAPAQASKKNRAVPTPQKATTPPAAASKLA